jgi:hypothetical protein
MVYDEYFMAAPIASFVAQPARNTPEGLGLWLAMAPTSSNSVVSIPDEKGVEDMEFDAGVETICQ